MERIMNEQINLDHNVEGDAAEGPVVGASREEVFQTLNENREQLLIAASGGVVQVMAEICQSKMDLKCPLSGL